jgi:hypothetical protein
MQTYRTWFAAMIFVVPCAILVLIESVAPELTPTGPVNGRVTCNGQPLEAGVVYFDPIEGDPSDRTAGLIGKDGVYSIDSGWRRGHAKFRIAVMPDLRHPSTSPPARFTNVRTSSLRVNLDREAARVDLDLKN